MVFLIGYRFSFREIFCLVIGVITIVLRSGDAARILCVFPTPSKSHQVVFRGLTLALHERGHELVIVTPDPISDTNMVNYTEIGVNFLYDHLNPPNWIQNRKKHHWLLHVSKVSDIMHANAETILNLPEMKKIYEPNNDQKFDLVLMEVFFSRIFYPIVERFGAPWIGISTLELDQITHYAIGNPVMPSHPSNWEMGAGIVESLTFWERLKDYIDVWTYLHRFQTRVIPYQEEVARKYFGDYGSNIFTIEKNVSVILTYQQTAISHVKPTVPKVVRIGGYHILAQSQYLEKELKEFLDGAEEGFVYMSLGSNAKSTMLSNRTREELMIAFSRIPYKVLWKFEGTSPAGIPENVYTMEWIPQRAVLAHPNIKVFVYQGGLQSTEESIAYGVPLVGLPVFSDQDGQVDKMVSLGVCEKLEITELRADDFIRAVTTIATDHRYKERMLNLRSLVNDKPQNPLETAVWWVEHVIRHRGTPYLDSSTADLPWYRRGDIDLVAFITASCLMASVILVGILYRLSIHTLNILSRVTKEKVH